VPIKKGPGKFKNSNLQQQLLATTFCLTENTLSQTGCPKSKRCKTVDVSILYPELLATQTYIKFKDAKISSDSFYPTQLLLFCMSLPAQARCHCGKQWDAAKCQKTEEQRL
jgi:hypothetical protein